jgi:uncharacterized membrane protein YgcG
MERRSEIAVRLILLGCLAVGGAVLTARSAGAQSPVERIRSYDIEVRIAPSGEMLVAERIEYDFGATRKHGIFRSIPVRFHFDDRHDRVYPIDLIAVEGSPGTPDDHVTNEEGGALVIQIGDPDETITGLHSYSISYRVEGALNGFKDHDELFWNLVGDTWEVPIDRVTARVWMPADLTEVECFAGPTGSHGSCDDASVQGAIATFGHTRLFPFSGLTVVVGIPKGAVPAPRPVLVERWSFTRAFSATPATVTITSVLLALVIGAVGWVMWHQGRDRRAIGSAVDVAYGSAGEGEETVPLFDRSAIAVEYAPPDHIRPGQIGTLVDEVANPLDVTATIVDLGVRGYLRIEEIPKGWLFGKPDWRLVRLKDADGDLLRYERLLFEGMFGEGDDVAKEDDLDHDEAAPSASGLEAVRLSALRKRFATRLRQVQDALYQDGVQRRWFAGRPDKVRGTWQAAGWVVFLAGAGLTAILAWKTHLGLLPVPIALGGMVLAIGGRWMPRRTPRGTGLVRRVQGFRMYIATAEVQESQFAERENLFYRYLPYAVVFGLTDRWARAFADLDRQASAASWYVGSRPFSVHTLTSSIDSFTVSSAGTISSTPSGSGSSGFGGGGSSGGGGGGGGGGSW